jgi:hypothetical protein
MTGPLRRFDMRALFAAVDAARTARGLSWVELAAEVNKPFAGTPSIPISAGTIRSFDKKSSVTSAVILQILRWLGKAPEAFLVPPGPIRAEDALPEPGASRILRFDTRVMFAALDAERKRREMTWREVAAELPGFKENMLRNLSTGPLIGFPRVMLIPQWLDVPAVSFVRAHPR